MKPETQFGKNLGEILEFLDCRQAEFARRVGCTQAAISQIVNGEREPSVATINKILEVLPVTYERLMRERR